MGISLPSLQDIAGWLLHQLRIWFIILVDTRAFTDQIREEMRSNLDNVIIRLVSFAAFIFLIDAMFSFPYDAFVLKLNVFSPSIFFVAIALFCIDIMVSLICLQIAVRPVTQHRDLRVALIFVLVMLAFYPIVHIAHAPVRLMLPDEAIQALYAANFGYFIQFGRSLETIGLLAKLTFVYLLYVGVFVWYLKRSTIALSELYSISLFKSFFVILTTIIAKGFVEAIFIGPLFLEVLRSRPV